MSITFTSAQIGYTNPTLPRIEAPEIAVAQFNNNTVNVNNSNCWRGDCIGFRNPFNQNLNTTNAPTFNGLTSNAVINSYIAGISGEWLRFGVLGGAIPIGHITSENGVFQMEPFSGFDIYIGNLSKVAFRGTNAGYYDAVASAGINFYLGATKTLESNMTRTHVYTNFTASGVQSNFTNNVFIGNNLTVGQIARTQYLNASREVCVEGGVCLNKTIEVLTTNLLQNGSIVYYNGTRWLSLNKTVGNNLALVYCNTGGFSWVDNTAGTCPI